MQTVYYKKTAEHPHNVGQRYRQLKLEGGPIHLIAEVEPVLSAMEYCHIVDLVDSKGIVIKRLKQRASQ